VAEATLNSHFRSLEIRMKRTERLLKVVLCSFLLFLCYFASLMLRPKPIQAASSETLRVRKLVVLDEAGKERIVIAAPIPDPVVDGKTVKRRVAVGAGISVHHPTK
jgi:hypothetical protein